MQPTEMLVSIVAITAVFGASAYIAHLIVEAMRARQRMRLTSEFQAKLLDRVGSAQELGAFLNSEGGARLLATMSPSRLEGGPPSGSFVRSRPEIIAGIAAATILLVWAAPTVGRRIVAPFLALLG